MRIVGGSLKGRAFNPGKKFTARPTTDYAKEALFNILQNKVDIESAKILDLFSGTGSLSYEFASRGATDITSVELNARHCAFIKQTIKELNLSGIKVIKADAFKYVNKCETSYDIIFADPPFDHRNLQILPKTVIEAGILNPEGLIIIEHPAEYNFSKEKNFIEMRRYGHVHFSFFAAE
ncbi:16S rRNA (guanine(966)-N(2))-methyltransferase RsmD [Puteibacter caeruleilacunae]|nr:16S rRNA (guanine(966)-N(2))-methyltransferase RsmD [Puteibacter caeruleilacunae]